MTIITRMSACSVTAIRGALIAASLLGVAAPGYAVDNEWQHDWTVFMVASNGAWGVATHPNINRAIALALRDCRAMSNGPNDCGAKSATVRVGWSVGILCGDQTIIVAAKQLADAERNAMDRETELRRVYRPNMPPCTHVVTVNPHGVVGAPYVHAATRR